MGATTPAVERPMFLSADKRKISYRSKNGSTITLEFKNKNSPAVDGLRELSKKNPVPNAESKITATVNGQELDAEGKQQQQNLWLGVYDTLSFWVMEAMEIAAFGPYDDPPK
ncbi:hypothetical protein PRZ48_010377 [Zasmidium cellare]|uniref:Uncharacterized protein n=1 Tax=Zasmidium cellare TaxID=395010 RepID=A0ABR0E8G8_ZASCE|nr:hypothetical protein PRZ48_010377 [Zasmidium cellare]